MIVFHVHVVVVLLDRMVSGRGYDRCGIPSVAQRLMHACRKSCNPTRNIPVILTTAFSYGSLVDRAIMHKPFALKIASCRNAATLPTGWHVQWQKNKEGIYRMGIGPTARLSKDA